MQNQEKFAQEEKFWGPEYGSIYPALEDTEPYKQLLSKIEEFVHPKKDEKWIDLGTGSGALIDVLWSKSKGDLSKLFALDLTDTMLNHLKKRLPFLHPQPKQDQIKLVKYNLSKRMPFKDNEFDGVVSSLVLTYITKHEDKEGVEALQSLFNEISRILKIGGQFVWTTPKYKVNFAKVFVASWKSMLNPKKFKNLYYGPAILRYALKIQKKGKKGEYHFLPEKEFVQMLKNTGFGDIKIDYSFAKQAIIFSSIKKQ